MHKFLLLISLIFFQVFAYGETRQCVSVFQKTIFANPEINRLAIQSLELSALLSDHALTPRQRKDIEDQLYATYEHMAHQSMLQALSSQEPKSWLRRLLDDHKTPRPLILLDSYFGEFYGKTTVITGRGVRQQVPYMTEQERRQTQIELDENVLIFSATKQPVPSTVSGEFVVGMDGELYVASHLKPHPRNFRHSSFFAGAPVLFAGTIMMNTKGEIESLRSRSGHYRPSMQHFTWVQSYLQAKGFRLLPNCCRHDFRDR